MPTSPETGSVERLFRALHDQLRDLPAVSRWVACSGGRDSMVLLHLLCRLHAQQGAPPPRVLHVNHGLHPEAAHWARQVQGWSAALGAECRVLTVQVARDGDRGLEAAARQARYQAWADVLPAQHALLLAQHRDDQAETVLLRLLRGSGPTGLAAMPVRRPLGAGLLCRPLLQADREDLARVAEQLGVPWLEDPSNLDSRHDRNYLRQQVLPRIERRWPGYRQTLTRAAALVSEQQTLLDAQLGEGMQAGLPLPLDRLAAEVSRGTAQLHLWLARNGIQSPSQARLLELHRQALQARVDARMRVEVGAFHVRRFAGALHLVPAIRAALPRGPLTWTLTEPCELPHGRLLACCTDGAGLPAALARAEVRFRQGGERFQPAGRRHSMPLKKWFQSAQVPPWERDRLPLVCVAGQVVAVADLAVAEGWLQRPGRVLRWQPRDAGTGLPTGNPD